MNTFGGDGDNRYGHRKIVCPRVNELEWQMLNDCKTVTNKHFCKLLDEEVMTATNTEGLYVHVDLNGHELRLLNDNETERNNKYSWAR